MSRKTTEDHADGPTKSPTPSGPQPTWRDKPGPPAGDGRGMTRLPDSSAVGAAEPNGFEDEVLEPWDGPTPHSSQSLQAALGATAKPKPTAGQVSDHYAIHWISTYD